MFKCTYKLCLNYSFNFNFYYFACTLKKSNAMEVILNCNQRDFILVCKWLTHCCQLLNLIYIELMVLIVIDGILQIKWLVVPLENNNYSYIYRINFRSWFWKKCTNFDIWSWPIMSNVKKVHCLLEGWCANLPYLSLHQVILAILEKIKILIIKAFFIKIIIKFELLIHAKIKAARLIYMANKKKK